MNTRTLCALALLLMTYPLAAQTAPPDRPAGCALSGLVVDSLTGEPLANARITLDGERTGYAAATTNAKGVFQFSGIPAGTYKVRAQRAGYLATHYGARRAGGPATPLKLEKGCDERALPIKLEPFAVVGGTVRGADGEPVMLARVSLFQQTYDATGRKRMLYRFSASADDLGHYRIAGVLPGRYYVSATPYEWPPASTELVSAEASREPVPSPGFYPGSATLAGASVLEVNAGDRLTAVDLSIPSLRLFRVSGQFASVRPVGIELNPDDMTGGYVSARVAADGSFTFPGVPPGAYHMRGYANGRQFSFPVRVADADVENLRPTELAPLPVKGRVVADAPLKILAGIIAFRFTGEQPNDQTSAQITADLGGLQGEVLPGQRRATAFYSSAPKNVYVKSLLVGHADALADGFEAPQSGTVEMVATIGMDAGTVEGIAQDANGQPVSGATVLLAPASGSRVDLFQSVTADQRGHFTITRVPPGEYRLYGWDDVEPYIWFDPAFLEQTKAKPEKLTIEPNGAETVSVKVAAP